MPGIGSCAHLPLQLLRLLELPRREADSLRALSVRLPRKPSQPASQGLEKDRCPVWPQWPCLQCAVWGWAERKSPG